jgi:hypothetical protein
MSYYPLLKAPGCKSWTSLCNFAPNNWEDKGIAKKQINVTWADDGKWHSRNIGELNENEIQTIDESEISSFIPNTALPLLSLCNRNLPETSAELPRVKSTTVMPAWRASLGLSTSKTSTSYQGEIDPFPAPGTLLTFSPFFQFEKEVENYMILLNIEKSPTQRTSVVEVYDSTKRSLKAKFDIKNNAANIIVLDDLGFLEDDLILTVCRGMCAIPLYISKTTDGAFMSMEHTHPPASFAIHGNRWGVQKVLKDLWFRKTKNENT